VVPWVAQKAVNELTVSSAKNSTEEQKTRYKDENKFSQMSSRAFGSEGRDLDRKEIREELKKYYKKLEEGDEEVKNLS